ncbi:S-layer homology domain-containing protein [Paenibacillus sp. CN-4]|uniref:S-layer homology domain-containing protein n=1 Tax=Paenibacillus nanchangensis TaxID=3348343 RepID=UPI00397DEE79
MQRMKRPFVWLLLAALLVSLFPGGRYTPVVSAAAAGVTSYFSPDDLTLRETAKLKTDSSEPATQISRDKVYKTSNSSITITGTYSQVTASTMKVTVEQLTQDSNGKWVTDSSRITTGSVTTDINNPGNRFTTSGVVLYTGFNKITFTGLQGNLQRSESFYVLYDKVPFITSLQVLGGPTAQNLNEGTQVVVPVDQVTLQGKVANATTVTVSLNGAPALNTSLLEDGTFFTPAMTLKPGVSTLKIIVSNSSDSITIDRTLYYFDKDQPFASLKLKHGGQEYNLINNTPTLSADSVNVAGLAGQILVPYSDKSFQSNAKFTINKGTTSELVVAVTANPDVTIPGSDGVTPAYRLVTFQTTGTDTIPITAGNQEFRLTVDYDTFTTSLINKYKYLSGETVITDMYLLPGFKPGDSVKSTSKLPLSGQQVESDSFYIMVKSNVKPKKLLQASYLPLSVKGLNLGSPVAAADLDEHGTEQVYQVTGFSNGQQKVQFRFEDSQSFYNADISYVSKNYIYVKNIQDGQTYPFNSSNQNSLTVEGEYIGFENINSAQMQVNGKNVKDMQGISGDFKVGEAAGGGVVKTFKVTLPITASGPLVYGENKLVFTGISRDGNLNDRVITKEIRIYIIDENVSTLKQFHPALSAGRPTITANSLTNEAERNAILALPAEFVYKDEKYVTTQNSYDLVLRGGGATTLNLYRGSDLVFSSAGQGQEQMLKDGASASTIGFTYNGSVIYDYVGTQTDFLLRIRDFKFDAPGSHVYTLELINDTGARTTQRLEVQKEVLPYNILSPVATVGDQIVVNKNFVRFDIEAEGATKVMIDKYEATPRNDLPNRFTYDFVGLKPDKATTIKIQIVRKDSTLNDKVNVYYASAVQIDTQYMAEKVSNKYTAFNKELTLSFPKGTVMKGFTSSGAAKYYPDKKLLFGIADPVDGVVERKNDYGNIINVSPADARTPEGKSPLVIPQELSLRFTSTASTNNFQRVSDIYWISGGLGEDGTKGTGTYKPATNGLAPYSIEGYFTQYSQTRKIVPSQRGSLTLTFSNSVVDEVGSTVTVFRYTDSGKWENIGGEVDTKKHTVTVPFDEFGYYTVMKMRRGYSDITNHPWARNVLNGLFSKGIMTNLRADSFGADDTTTRGEFATLLVKGLNIPLSYNASQQTFFDIVPEAVSTTWDFKHIETAARAGIVTGLSDGFFGPDQPLTREQAAVMIARALKLKMSANNDKLLSSLTKSFVDTGSMEYYSRPAIEAVTKAQIMQGSASTTAGQKKPVYSFNPKGKLTRAEAGKITVALLQKSTKIFPKTFN